ncbi:hypothetical protein ABL78_8354 [Leptomonas seymouri]|uniref:Uncharacterized protein n=1 Tax=Leptomonas seymouri TaxID=5684 RepID=A0A0N0P279_LEPSE|nr:hypothetical protein ABL78_8354 [Leptomonas seymouri]|eukprot:KPI82636.1 hypothetical protein ABL78_8354 [Leptomonas seymouri]
MRSMCKLSAAAMLALAAAGVPSAYAATTPSAVPAPVNLNQNIVTIVLILGVSIAVSLIFVLSKLIPKLRRGELSLSKMEFDWRAELLNQTPTKEKARRAEETARRNEERARRNEERAAGRYADVDERGMHFCNRAEPLSHHDAAVPEANAGEKRDAK